RRNPSRSLEPSAAAATSALSFLLRSKMKFIAAYLLAYLSGNASPSAEDLTSILESGNFVLLGGLH
uniref:Uncharacterized protein n=1 Tax=Aegilops tauschii subsp. strangulata TaxID=200361 RepID=A0A453BXM1_AEGTS